MPEANQLEKKINALRDQITDAVITDIEQHPTHAKSGFYFNKLISSCEKIGDSILNINEAVSGVNIE